MSVSKQDRINDVASTHRTLQEFHRNSWRRLHERNTLEDEKLNITKMLTVFAGIITGLTTIAQASDVDSLLQQVQADADATRIQRDIEKLVSFGTRHTLSDTQSDDRGIGAARRWVKSEFEAISRECGGCLEVFYVSDFVEGEPRIPERTEVVNVIAVQRGRYDPDRVVMMSGDIDSRVSDPLDGTSDSPGANDNASGLAGVLEAARVPLRLH